MNVFATPIQRDHFVYHNELLVDPGNNKQYRRASEPQLTALLKPGPNASAAKDETAHFYEAQLIHYGLQRTKDKARAKWRLLEALNAGSLAVPSGVKKIEGELRKEHNSGSRKGQSTVTVDVTVNISNSSNKSVTQDTKAVGALKKRKAGDVPDTPAKPKRAATSTNNTSKSATNTFPGSASPKTTTSRANAPKNTARCSRGNVAGARAWASNGQRPASEAQPPPRKIQTARRSTHSSGPIRPSTAQGNNSDEQPPIRKPQTARRGGLHASPSTRAPVPQSNTQPRGPSATTKQTARRGPSSSYPHGRLFPEVKQDPEPPSTPQKKTDTVPAYSSSSSSEVLMVTGHYALASPEIERNFSATCMLRIRIVHSDSGDVAWGAYDFGVVAGVFKAWLVNFGAKGSADFQLEWRGQGATDGGEMSLGAGNVGGFTVYRDGSMGGTFRGMWGGTELEFTGERVEGSEWDVGDDEVGQWEEEWWGCEMGISL